MYKKRGGKKSKANRTSCRCKNHMGTRKAAHRSFEAALDAAIAQAKAGRPASTYPCPTDPTRWHVRTRR